MIASAHDEVVDHALIENRAQSLAHLFRSRVDATPQAEAYRYPVGHEWVSVTWSQVRDLVYRYAAGLLALGVKEEDRISLASATRYEWVLADLTIACSGGATTTIYPSTSPADVAYIVSDSGSTVIFAEDDAQVAKLRERRGELGDVTKVVTFDGTPDGDWVISLDDLAALGDAHLAEHPTAVDDRIDALTPHHLSTIMYTSGTTGRPKGVLLTQDAFVYEGAAVAAVRILDSTDLQYLWLPLSHSFGKVLLTVAMQIGLPTAVDGRIDKIVENLAVVRPTFMGAAPRIFEKVHSRVTMAVAADGGIKEKLFHWAMGVGKAVDERRLAGEGPAGILALQHAIADKLVLAKVRDRFGGRVRFFISGSAALNPDVAGWFGAAGLTIIEGYGLTETSAASCVNRPYPGHYRYGTVGWPLPGTEVKIAEDGEILLKGPGVMRGYHNRPEDTAEALDAEGYLHSGDIGHVDERGFVFITDRKKDLFKTSGGKYIAPSAIEAAFKGVCPYVSQMLVYGESRNFASALITLDPELIVGWAAQNAMEGQEYAAIVTSAAARDMVQGYVDELNQGLNRWETIKSFSILDRDFTIEDGEITPSMKLRRKVVTDKYKPVLEAHYSS
ncbi:MAG TPA: long-chain fatty acid--CoA ligase [Candidatus Lustribacter sp.]|nr:long-chain fatty acid--CoA ligase [Candidatus Lustribacter sp.]